MVVRTRTVLCAVSALLFAGCAFPPKSDSAFVPRDCATSGGGRTCAVIISADPSGAYRCELGRFSIDPDFLRLIGRDAVKIQFRVQSPHAFCDGDRPFLKDGIAGTAELFESYASSGEDGARLADERIGACRRVWNWSWGNVTPDAEYRYGITFRDEKSGRTCTIDPWVRNGR